MTAAYCKFEYLFTGKKFGRVCGHSPVKLFSFFRTIPIVVVLFVSITYGIKKGEKKKLQGCVLQALSGHKKYFFFHRSNIVFFVDNCRLFFRKIPQLVGYFS
jgi:hypothetical protein